MDVGASIDVREAVLLWRGEAPGAEGSDIVGGILADRTRYPQIDEVRPVGCEDDVGGRDVAVHYPVRVQVGGRLAEVAHHLHRLLRREAPASGHRVLERVAGNVIVDDCEPVGHLVGGRHPRQTRAGAFRERGPRAAVRKRRGDFLAHERARPVDGHAFRCSCAPFGEHALHPISIIDGHRVHDPLLVQPGYPRSRHAFRNHLLRRTLAVADAAEPPSVEAVSGKVMSQIVDGLRSVVPQPATEFLPPLV